MKRSLTSALALLLLAGATFAGGIVTNTNQSAMYTRMVARQATLGIDAVYYNPAGLTKLENGIHLSINNQTIGQTRTITSDYSYLNNGTFKGEVFAAAFPGVYGVFKMGKLAISAGFNPIGGGGGAEYATGLPSFEYSPADLVPALQSQGQNVTAYRMNAFLEGSSIFFGYQANVSYAINDMISVAIGGRFVTAKDKYTGYLKDIDILLDDNWTPATDFFAGAAAQYTTAATNANNGSLLVQGDVAGGAALTDPLTNVGAQTILAALGVPAAAIALMDNQTAIGTLNGIYDGAITSAGESTVTSALLADQDVETEKTASGFTPIVSLNIQPIDMLNIAIKYEHLTKLEFTNKTAAGKGGTVGFDASTGQYITLFPDGAKTNLDMPALLSVGATLNPLDALLIATGFTYYFDKNANWGGREELLDANSWDLAIGAEYALGDKLLASASWSMTETGAMDTYQTDLSYSLSTTGISFGIGYNILSNLQLNLGAQLVNYKDGQRNFQHDLANSGAMIPVLETYGKTVWVVGAGLNYSLSR
ncbi:hypothetical protein ACFLTU_03655 [Bacteroidota bacterium]